jgi:HSP20 family protein
MIGQMMRTHNTKPGLKTPFDMFQDLTQDWEWNYIPNLFGKLYRPETAPWTPKMDFFEKNGEFVVKADLPGVAKEDVKVYLEENYLIVQGERKAETEVKEEDFFRTEREYGLFYRKLPLNFEVDPGLIQATFKDGVLEVKVPMLGRKGPEPRPIPIG